MVLAALTQLAHPLGTSHRQLSCCVDVVMVVEPDWLSRDVHFISALFVRCLRCPITCPRPDNK